MGDKARQYKPSTIRRLDTLSGNQCAAPDCTRPLIAKDGASIISKICHIEAASENGPRFNSTMNDDQRRHFDNLILLCDECHTIIDNIDNESKYPVSLLKSWKRDHETQVQLQLLQNKPGLLKQAINGIASMSFEDDVSDDEVISSFRIEDKIVHNSLRRNSYLILEYAKFFPKINSLYLELESQGSFKKERLLRNIKLLYIRIRGEYLGEGKTLNDNSDDIFESIENKLMDQLGKSDIDEDIAFAIPIIMVDSFIRCNILENPNLS